MILKRKIFSLLMVTSTLTPALADEGMWLLPMLKTQNLEQIKKAGLSLEIEDIYSEDGVSLKDAVVIFGNGCTGEIISSEGLLLTNHHCGYESIQQHSSLEHDYLRDGFWAMTRQQELHTPGLRVQFIEKIQDVTDIVKKELQQDNGKKEFDYLSPAYLSKVAKKYFEQYTDRYTEVEIKPIYNGNQYYMYVKRSYPDVRMVGAPPSSIGKFGADTDNWMWPRHTGDFSLFRVYSDTQGNPAEYSENNIPLRPKKWFSISLGGIQENDYAMIIGFPGSTNRYYTSEEIRSRCNVSNQVRIDVRGVRQQVLLQEMLKDQAVNIQYASKYARSSNYYKNSIGMNKAVAALKVYEEKIKKEEEFRTWCRQSGNTQYADALDNINATMQQADTVIKYLGYLDESFFRAVEFTQVPTDFELLKRALKRNDKAAIEIEIEKLTAEYEDFADRDYNADVDRKVTKAILKQYINDVPQEYRPEIINEISKKYKANSDSFADDCFKNSVFACQANFENFCTNPKWKKLKKDPMVKFALSVKAKRKELNKLMQKFSKKLRTDRKIYTEGLLKMNQGKPMYPDANFTMRLSYGNCLSYTNANGERMPLVTTLEGVMEKENPKSWEFIVPEKLKELFSAKDFGQYADKGGKLPVNFLSTNDITGGNSGSPVINAEGELIGCAFDGNWDAMSGDILFDRKMQRTINLDIRYMLFIVDKYAGASHLIEEMDIKK